MERTPLHIHVSPRPRRWSLLLLFCVEHTHVHRSSSLCFQSSTTVHRSPGPPTIPSAMMFPVRPLPPSSPFAPVLRLVLIGQQIIASGRRVVDEHRC